MRTAARAAVQCATASPGLMVLLSSFPFKKSFSNFWNFGIEVERPLAQFHESGSCQVGHPSAICLQASGYHSRDKTELLKVGSGHRRGKTHTLIERINFNPGTSKEIQNTFCLPTGSLGWHTTCLLEAISFLCLRSNSSQTVIKILPFPVGVTSCGFYFKGTILGV